jgi:hypothetical protein
VQVWHAAKDGVDAVGGKKAAPAAPEVIGVRLYAVNEKDLPKAIRDEPSIAHAGVYHIHPAIVRDADGKESVGYYKAVRGGHVDFAIGKDSLDQFKAHPELYQQQADYDSGWAHARPYEQEVYKTGESVSNGDAKGALVHGARSWEHAFGDWTWTAQRMADVAVASAPEAHGGTSRPPEASPGAHAKPIESAPKPVETTKPTETKAVDATAPKTGKALGLASNPDYRPSLDAKWFEPDGSVRWPPNNGAVGAERPVTLARGTTIDRYGSERGKYASPAGAPYGARALPYEQTKMPYARYEVVKEFPAHESVAAPWFDEPGGATQFRTDKPIADLVREGYLRKVK